MLIEPDWPAPKHVRAYSSTRLGGVSQSPFDALNISEKVGDRPASVAENRRRLAHAAGLPGGPAWLALEHGTRVLRADAISEHDDRADASYSRTPGQVCVVTSADCLPALICDRAGSVVAVAHCGWRGLAAGVLEAVVEAIEVPPSSLLVWLGPAIGAQVYEVGEEVREAFVRHSEQARQHFTTSPAGRWLADLPGLARQRLRALGVDQVHDCGLCTYSDPQRFFSYRRDGRTGRMASLIWLDPTP